MAIREGRWDCPSCGSTAIYGRHVDCPGCGKPRPAGVRFYLADGEPVVTDPTRLAEAKAGADWVCARCGASNRATLHSCGGCGAAHEVERIQPVAEYTLENTPRSGDAERKASAAPSTGSALPPSPESPSADAPSASSGSATPSSTESPSASAPSPPDESTPAPSAGSVSAPVPPRRPGSTPPWSRRAGAPDKSSASDPSSDALGLFPGEEPAMPLRRKVGWAVAGAMGVVVLAGMMGDFSVQRTPRPVPAVVDVVVWERQIVMEEHGIVPGEGWELPDSATDVVRSERVSEYRQELAGYQTVSRQVPRTERVLQGYREESRSYEEREQTGTHTYTCGTRDLGNGYFEDVECTEPIYETRTRSEPVSVPVYEERTVYETVTEEQPVYRQVPVMAPYYTYRAPRWTPVDTLRRSGSWMTPPAWPVTDTAANRRESWRRGSNDVIVRTADGVRLRVRVDEGQLARLRPGQRVAFALSGGRRPHDAVLSPDSLRACRRWLSGRGKSPPESLGCSPRPARARR